MACQEFKEWFEETIEKPIDEAIRRKVERCKRKKCKWWCGCCNKWLCWIDIAITWIRKWIEVIVGKWIVYSICRILSVFFTLLLTLANLLFGMPISLGWCLFWGKDDLDALPPRNLQVEVVIIDQDEENRNPVTSREIELRIQDADRILWEEARIHVRQRGDIRREISASLFRLDASGIAGHLSEYLKALFLVAGRGSPRYLTIYYVGSINGAEGLHQPLYGSVFALEGNPDTTLCHEIGHSLLSVFNAYHSSVKDALMHVPYTEREAQCNWRKGVPHLSRTERCAMRRSRWLDLSWGPFP